MRIPIVVQLLLVLGLLNGPAALAQEDDLDKLLDALEEPQTEYVLGAFKATRVVNLQSIEKKAPGSLEFRISHRFGAINGGLYEIWGLDQATMRMGLDYGISQHVMVGVGRSTYQKALDAFLKASLLRQSTGARKMPVSVLYLAAMAKNGLKWNNPDRKNYFTSRLSYTHQLIIGSKASERISWQLSPTLVHHNLVETRQDQNTRYAVGAAARYKISRRTALTAEYVHRIPPATLTPAFSNYYNSLSLGLDIETGGHVFQLHLSNSLPMVESTVITATNQSWANQGIHFGFNITRDFTIVSPKHK